MQKMYFRFMHNWLLPSPISTVVLNLKVQFIPSETFSCFKGNQWKQCLTLTENHKFDKSLKNLGLQIKRLHCFDKESVSNL